MQRNYVLGYEEGLQQGWDEKGDFIFSYSKKDGRKYGLLGSKPCFTVKGESDEKI